MEMRFTPSLIMIYLAIVFATGIIAGLMIHRAYLRGVDNARPADPAGGEGMSGAVGFIGGTAAFLLSLLMLGSLDHYNSTKAIVADEALAYSAAFESTNELAPEDQAKARRDLVCLMRSVATNSWAAAQSEDLTGSDNTHAWRRRASADATTVTTRTKAQENSLNTLQTELINASKSGQQRLLAAEADLPIALWGLVFLSIFVLVAMLTALLSSYPSRILAVTSMVGALLMSAAMVWTLSAFDQPFDQGDGVYISPRDINAVMVRMEGTYPGAAWAPCELLADR